MITSQRGIDLIKKFEGLRLTAYKCPSNIYTIGFGHTLGVKAGDTITEEEAETLLKADLKPGERLLAFVGIKINQNQYDALSSLIFNIGTGNFKSSQLLKRLKSDPDDPKIRDEFMKWIKGGGEVLPGLVTRRDEESQLYFTPC